MGMVLVDQGVLRMALNVLRRADKMEVADELERSATEAAPLKQQLDDMASARDAAITMLNNANAEVARLRQFFLNPEVAGIDVHHNTLRLGLEGGAAQVLAEALAAQFKEAGAENYLELVFSADQTSVGPLVVTVQRGEGKTPGQLRQETEQKLDRQRDTLREAVALLAASAGPWDALRALLQCRDDAEALALMDDSAALFDPACVAVRVAAGVDTAGGKRSDG